jgi:hypothetical protein
MDSSLCPMCGALVPACMASCRAIFEDVCTREYSDLAYGAVHLLTVDAYALQHSEEHGPRSNAFHLMRLCSLLEGGANPGIGQRPPRHIGKAFEGHYLELPTLAPPPRRGSQTIVAVHGAQDAEEHAERVRGWAWSVWDAYSVHHEWARMSSGAWSKKGAVSNGRSK